MPIFIHDEKWLDNYYLCKILPYNFVNFMRGIFLTKLKGGDQLSILNNLLTSKVSAK